MGLVKEQDPGRKGNYDVHAHCAVRALRALSAHSRRIRHGAELTRPFNEGGNQMRQYTWRYARYALSVLTSVGFGIALN
jgi:hypothetical protein